MTIKTSLTGVTPTSTPHIGNYLGAIKPALSLAGEYRTLYFIADYHAITKLQDPEKLRSHIYDVAATWLACGLDHKKTILYRQSDVIEVFELAWILGSLCATGQLERGHAYKDAIGKGLTANAGLFNYPLLMAADIILYDTDVVPVGKDQTQHLELTRDLATRLNSRFGEGTVVVPEARISEGPLVPGTDGQKMSKSYGNSIPLFVPGKKLRKTVMGIVTGSEDLEQSKDPDGSTVFQMYELVATADEVATMADKLRAGGYGWGHAKEDLYQALERELGPKRENYVTLRNNEEVIDGILEEGAKAARLIARRTMRRVREAIGISGSAREQKTTVRLKP